MIGILKGFLLKIFWDITGKPTREEAERMARTRSVMKEFPAIECENRIKELWKREERKRFRIVR